MGVGSVRVESGSSGDTESEVHRVCVCEAVVFGRRMQACGLVRVSGGGARGGCMQAQGCRRMHVHVTAAQSKPVAYALASVTKLVASADERAMSRCAWASARVC